MKLNDWQRIGAVVSILWILSGASRAASATEQYELAERCGKQAKADWAWRNQDRPGLYGPNSFVRYENHYSAKFNKCYVMHVITQPQEGGDTWVLHTLFDVNENKSIASYSGVDGGETGICERLKERCTSKTEWDRLIRPYWKQ